MVRNVAPTIEGFSGDSFSQVGRTISFRAIASDPAGTADPLLFNWDFGDGSPNASGINLVSPNHAYQTDGRYELVLTVSDGDGGSVQFTSTIVIGDFEVLDIFDNNGIPFGRGDSNDVDLADLDSDGDLDAFITHAALQPDRVWINRGNGSFYDSGQALGTSTSVYSALGDIDNDGDIDAVVASANENHVYLNNGYGEFRLDSSLGNVFSIDVALGDLNSDGSLDIFFANNGTEPNTVWMNNGFGRFTRQPATFGSSDSKSVVLADVDGDLDLDAVIGNGGATGQANKIWLNNGVGHFIDSGQNLGNSSTQHVAAADLDGDGDVDLFDGNGGANFVWFNNGAGIFTTSGQLLGDASTSHVELADFDQDGDLDAFTSNCNNCNPTGSPNQENLVWIKLRKLV